MKDFEILCRTYQDIILENPEVKDFNYRSKEGLKLWRQRKQIRREKMLMDEIECGWLNWKMIPVWV